jgi:putative ABC transport system permease protein
MSHLIQDFRHAIRSLAKSPGFVAAAVIVMALGIGANTAIFSVVSAVLLRPLPYRDADRIVQLWHIPPQKSFPGLTRFGISPANYYDWASMSTSFEDTTLFRTHNANLTGVDHPESLTGSRVSLSFFRVFGIDPILGRVFAPGEDEPGKNHEVILSHSLWRDRFGEDKSIVGRKIELDGEPFTVIGVLGPRIATFAQFWTPLSLTSAQKAVRGNHNMYAAAKLKPGVSVQQANAELASISQKLALAYPEDNTGWGAFASPIREEIVGEVRKPLLVLLAAVMFVLLIACANVANLLLARTLARRHEIAVRVALGASRRRLMQYVLSESVAVSLVGGALGFLLAHFGIKLIVAFLSTSLPKSVEIELDAKILMFTIAVSLITGIVAGMIPALRIASTDAGAALKQSSARTGTETGGSRTRSVLVVAEVALSLCLMVGAGLMIRTLWNLRHTDPGFDTQHTVSMTLGIAGNRYQSLPMEVQALDQIVQAVRSTPGVRDAALIDDLPLTGGNQMPIQAEGQPVVQISEQPEVAVRAVTPGYLRTMGIPLLQGRDLSSSDDASAPGAIVISQSLAKRIWPNENALGKRLTLSFFPDKVREVVGIVGDVKQESISSPDPVATLYEPFTQVESSKTQSFRGYPVWLVVRTDGTPSDITPSVLAAVHRIDSSMPVLNVSTLQDFIGETLSSERMTMTLLVAFAGLALTLAAIGIYSVLAYNVRRRIREIGIRMALGAQVTDILRLVVLQGMKSVAVGVAVGLLLSVLLGRTVSTMVYGVGPTDSATLILGSLMLFAIAITASLLPAYRATKVVPVRILREE